MSAPVVYAYNDYRRFLADWVVYKKKTGRFSLRGFAKRAGFGAHDILQVVISGKRNLSTKSIQKLAAALSLSSAQGEYFENLVLMNQAIDDRVQLLYYRRMLSHPQRKKVTPLETAKLSFFQHWAAPVVYELASFPDFKPDPAWIANQFDSMDLREAKRILNELVELGLLVQDERGRWRQCGEILDSGDGIKDIHLYSYHETSLMKAADSLRVPMSRRHVQIMVTAVPASILPKLILLAEQFEAEAWRCVEEADEDCDEVFQIGMQIFPLLQRKK